MPTIKDLKKTINHELSGVIEECYAWQLTNDKNAEKAEKIIDAAIESFDALIARVNVKGVENAEPINSDELELTQQCESAIRVGNWGTASKKASELIRHQSQLPDGYELKSRTLERQAAEAEGDAQPVKVVTSIRRRALRTLQDGIKKCPEAGAQRQLGLRLANLHRVMGDDASAEAITSNL